jgi:transposase
MSTSLLTDELWAVVAPLLPPTEPKPQGGRPRASDRAALEGILFILETGAPWRALPRGAGRPGVMTCWRRLRDWQAAGVWEQLQRVLLDRLGERAAIDWSRACLDSASIPAKKGVRRPGRTPPTAPKPAPSGT